MKSNAKFMQAGLLGVCVGGAVVAYRLATRRSFSGRTVLITGGSRGLGLELARLWGAEGARVIITARTLSDVQRAVSDLRRAGYNAHGCSCDVHSRGAAFEMVQQIIDRWGSIDVLVNCAGIIQVSPHACLTIDDFRDAIDTHVWGPLNLIDAVLPHMRRRGDGSIVNISSIGGVIPVPHLMPYCASKFALSGLSETLATELAADGIRVTTVCPGLMRTGSPRNAFFKGQHRKEYAWFTIGASLPFITMSSQRAARKIIHACRYGQPYLALSPPAKIATRIHALFPNTFIRAMRVVNAMLPGSDGGTRVNMFGKESESAVAPSPITWLNERAAARNNEIGAKQPVAGGA